MRISDWSSDVCSSDLGLARPESWFDAMRGAYQASRDRLVAGLRGAGYVVNACAATWFVTVDLPASGIDMDDVAFCERIIEEAGVAAIPISAIGRAPCRERVFQYV